MAEPFKNLINTALVQQAAERFQQVSPDFDRKHFARLASDGLESLEMKARALHICQALQATMPTDFNQSADILEAALAPPEPGESMAQLHGLTEGLRGWILWPVGEYIARCGLPHPERALRALHALTQRFTAEFAIRPFIENHPELSFTTLNRWVDDESAHVRRLVSEGSRPRLPWGQQLKALIKDPSPTLPLLQALQDDPSPYVRRSVSNHLNDIAKDHPKLISLWLKQHLPEASAERRSLLKHASRTLIKAGDPSVLKAWGLGGKFAGRAALKLTPARVRLGEQVQLSLNLQSSSKRDQSLAIDYAIHHVKADGSTSPKVFKGWVLQLPAGGIRELEKVHSMREITTRRYYAGRHQVTIQINGQMVAQSSFMLSMPATQ